MIWEENAEAVRDGFVNHTNTLARLVCRKAVGEPLIVNTAIITQAARIRMGTQFGDQMEGAI